MLLDPEKTALAQNNPPPSSTGLDDIVRTNFFTAFQAIGGDPSKLAPEKLASVMKRLLGRTRGLARNRVLSKDESLLDFKGKVLTNLTWLSGAHGISNQQFLGYLLKAPDVFMTAKPQTIQDNFNGIVAFLSRYEAKEKVTRKLLTVPKVWSHNPKNLETSFQENLAWMAEYGITETEWGKVLANTPAMLERSPATLKVHYDKIGKILTSRGVTKEQWKGAFLKHCSTIHLDPKRIETNISGTVKALKHHGMTDTLWATVCIKDPCLMGWPPETGKSNFEENVTWAALYGITPGELLNELTNYPHFFHRAPSSLHENYELMRITCAMPEYQRFKPRQHITSKPKKPALMRFNTLSYGEDNWLLRIALAELIGRKKEVYSTLSRPRSTVEKLFVRTLGHDPVQKAIPVSLNTNQLADANTTLGEKLNTDLHQHACDLRQAWKQNLDLAADKRKPLQTNVLGIMLPFGNPAQLSHSDKQTLLERSILAGLVKGYKLVTVNGVSPS